MNDSNVIIAALGGGRTTVTAKRYMTDYGQVLQITGADLPEVYRVDFANDEFKGNYVRMVGNADGVLIPKQFFESGLDIWAFLVSVTETAERTVAKIRIINANRPDNNVDPQPEPEEQDVIDSAIININRAVEKTNADAQATARDAEATARDAERAEQARDQSVTAKNTAVEAMQDAERYANSAGQSAEAAEQDKRAADEHAQAAALSAERAEQSAKDAGYMYFYINDEGDLIYQRTSNVNVDFYLDNDGDLHVRANG